MSTNQPPQGIMTSPVFRYAVLIVLCVVVVMGAGVCYRTRVYQRRMHALAAANGGQPAQVTPRDWGPAPRLVDVYLHPPSEKHEAEWGEIMPVSVKRAGLDASGVSSIAHIAVMIGMPFSQFGALGAQSPLPDEERQLPHLELGLFEADVRLTDGHLSPDSAGTAPKKGS
ncbi:hypothetical protein B0H15DRAFT_817640 [Mycena belliarum]|uniref:Uncharacterized protein n=1 Tax=Mycena belliarum TaxID=1033014 RepID=A0AAD6UEP6_9AGAR|nr:hypothetical protein B0H15DRAFT_817640 [Mycena belliae]